MQTKITFDKNYIQGKKQEWLENHIKNNKCYLSIITNQLKIECIGNYEKEFKDGRDPKNYTKSLCKKLNLFPSAKYNFVDLIKAEVCEGVKINQQHDFFGYVSQHYLTSNNQARDLFTDAVDPGKDQQIQNCCNNELHKECTIENEVVRGSDVISIAKAYKDNARGPNGFITTELEDAAKDKGLPPVPLEDLIDGIKGINFENPNIYSEFVSWLETKEVIPVKDSAQFIKARAQSRSLIEFAPYTAYVYTITLLYCYNILRNEKIPKKLYELDSDWMDVNYIFYFPFINCFASDDKFFKKFVDEFPCFNKIKIIDNNYTFRVDFK